MKIAYSPIERIGSAIANTDASLRLIFATMTKLKISCIGERTSILVTVMNAILICLMSMVRRVMRDGTVKWSMFLKENCWILLNITFRRLRT